nr:NAD(P)H-hydrate dehydratase [Sulfobacillus harzensis]
MPGHGQASFIDPEWAKRHLPRVPRLGHKYSRGHVVVIGGSRAMPGAPVLAGMAALKAGAGLVELVVPESVLGRVAVVPSLIVHGVPETADGSLQVSDVLSRLAARADALVIGPGLGPTAPTALIEVLAKIPVPAVLDADGIRLYAQAPKAFGANWVLTPHAGEMGVLLGMTSARVNADRRRAVLDAVHATGRTVLLKGMFSIVGSEGGRLMVNSSGSPVLATAGSGDVLSGMTAALLAQGLPPDQALALAVYWHGWAGQIGEREQGLSMTADNLLDYFSPARHALEQEEEPTSVTYWD